MKLFLQGGGGTRKDSMELDKRFVASLDLSKPLLYIPIAIDIERHPYPACYAWISDLLKPLGVNNIVMWIESDLKHKTQSEFEQFCGVYIGGGNTFKLLKELKKFDTFPILEKLAYEGMPLCGGSAGAIILAQTIFPALYGDENQVKLTNFSALALVHGYDVWCHHVPANNPVIKEYMKKYSLKKILAIPETAGLYVTEMSIEAIGPADITVFENGEINILRPGDMVLK